MYAGTAAHTHKGRQFPLSRVGIKNMHPRAANISPSGKKAKTMLLTASRLLVGKNSTSNAIPLGTPTPKLIPSRNLMKIMVYRPGAMEHSVPNKPTKKYEVRTAGLRPYLSPAMPPSKPPMVTPTNTADTIKLRSIAVTSYSCCNTRTMEDTVSISDPSRKTSPVDTTSTVAWDQVMPILSRALWTSVILGGKRVLDACAEK
mmetsp:Transcript_8186/g.19574  ORF Transcript_8186/g.19574 Transcript_8186/m.19574 type:complete len:202 (-) Transcript_8186:69-674(-)